MLNDARIQPMLPVSDLEALLLVAWEDLTPTQAAAWGWLATWSPRALR